MEEQFPDEFQRVQETDERPDPVSLVTMQHLNAKAFGGLLETLLVMASPLFLSAGTPRYSPAWILLAVFGVFSLAITLYLMKKDPELLERRVRGGPTAEKETSQKIIQSLTAVAFIAMLVVPGLDHRFARSRMPLYAEPAGDALAALGFIVIFFVYKENTFTSAIIDVYAGQTVISTGPYALVRHPMYAGGFLMFLGMSLAFGSWWGLLVLALMMPALIWRIVDEERLLTEKLPGYAKYKNKVAWRLVPFRVVRAPDSYSVPARVASTSSLPANSPSSVDPYTRSWALPDRVNCEGLLVCRPSGGTRTRLRSAQAREG